MNIWDFQISSGSKIMLIPQGNLWVGHSSALLDEIYYYCGLCVDTRFHRHRILKIETVYSFPQHQTSKKDAVGLTEHYEMTKYNVTPDGAWWYWVVYGDTVTWYLVVLGHYKLMLFCTWAFMVSIGLLCLYVYIEEVDIWSGVTDTSQTHRQQNIVQHSTWVLMTRSNKKT